MKFCPECGTKLNESHKFCVECGADLRKILNETAEIKEINKKQFDLNSLNLDNDVQSFGGTSFDSFDFNNGINTLNQNINNDLTKNELKALEPFETIKLSDGTYAIKSLKNKSEIIVNVPSCVSVIGDEAFADSDILEVTLSEGLIKIGNRAFANCKDLDTINFPKSLHVIGNEVFSGCLQLNISIPSYIRCTNVALKETKSENKLAELVNKANEYYELGKKYYYGHGIYQDFTEAVKYYQKAAELGNSDAQYFLGFCYENGKGTNKNYSEAINWYRKAAEQGNTNAQNNLGVCYENGLGVAPNYTMAINWYRRAANNGNAIAQNNLKRFGKS